MEIKTDEAIGVIKEWGIDCDNFVSQNYKQFLVGGEPDDNSIHLSEFYRDQLRIIVDLGLQEAKNRLFTDGG